MNKRLPRLLAAAMLLGAASLLLACSGDDDSEDSASTGGELATLHVAMQDIAYDTTALTARKGESVRIDLENRGQITHDFTVQRMPVEDVRMTGDSTMSEHMRGGMDYDLHLALGQGKKGQLEFQPTAAGQYEYFCTVPGHREAGMKGTLTVE